MLVKGLPYVGSKFKLLPMILPNLPQKEILIEPFCGGLNFSLNYISKQKYVNDFNSDIILFYRFLNNNTLNFVINSIQAQINAFDLNITTKEKYYRLRESFNNDFVESDEHVIKFFLLLKLCFNNSIRYNLKGKFNAPFGERQIGDLEDIASIHKAIKNNNFLFYRKDFSIFLMATLKEIIRTNSQNKTFLYVDPPYFNTGAAYNSTWTIKEEKMLVKILEKYYEQKIQFAISNVFENNKSNSIELQNFINKHNLNIFNLNYDYRTAFACAKKNKLETKMEVLMTN